MKHIKIFEKIVDYIYKIYKNIKKIINKMKHVKKFNTYEDYQSYVGSENFIQPNVSMCMNTDETYCTMLNTTYKITPTPPPTLLDILYSDANGNLSYTSKILPASEGKTPIGLCIAGTGFFGANEPARWMSLKYMSCTTPETGSLSNEYICYGNYETDISTIDNIQTTYNGGSNNGYLTVDHYDNSTETNKIPSILNENNEWNISVLGTVNQYAVTDIDGKNKTTKILAVATGQPNWQTDISITNTYEANYAPAACCCARYHTLGTSAGDWYLGACGEISMMITKYPDIDAKLAAINAVYPNDSISLLDVRYYWTSTKYDNVSVYSSNINRGLIRPDGKDYESNVIGMLQY